MLRSLGLGIVDDELVSSFLAVRGAFLLLHHLAALLDARELVVFLQRTIDLSKDEVRRIGRTPNLTLPCTPPCSPKRDIWRS